MTPNQHSEKIKALIVEIKAHPMCLKFEELPGMYRVLYPAGFQLDGAQARYAQNKTEALFRLLSAIERHWLESIPKAK